MHCTFVHRLPAWLHAMATVSLCQQGGQGLDCENRRQGRIEIDATS